MDVWSVIVLILTILGGAVALVPLLVLVLGRYRPALADILAKRSLTLAGVIGLINTRLGQAAAWAMILMVLIQVIVVVQRYVFGVGSVKLQESVLYAHAFVFMAAAGYALLNGAHVRVDIFYRPAPPRTKAMIDAAGAYLFVLPFMVLILTVGWPYVARSWAVFEASKESSGLPFVYIQKSFLIVFALSVLAQGWAMGARALLFLGGHVGHYGDTDGLAQDQSPAAQEGDPG